MAATIKIKRSGVTAVPQNLATAELAYSWEPSTGGVLYVGTGPEANNVAQSIDVIGGKYFTDKLDHSPGIVVSNSAIIVDDANRIDSLNIGFVTFSDNTITTQYYPYANTIPAGISEFSVPLVIQPLGGAPIDVTNSIITNVRTPDAPTDAANKDYVDQEVLELRQTTNMQVNGDVGAGTIVLNSEIFTISGDTGITTNMSGNKIEIDLDDTAVTPGSYGSETEIPVFTVDQQGRITLANTVSIATDLSIAADEGTIDSVFLLDDVLTFSGQTGITTFVSNNEIGINLDDTAVTAASYGSPSTVPFFIVDQQGRLTNASDISIQITKDQITDFAEEVQDVVGNFVTGDANSGISVAYTDSTNDFTISAEDATTTTKGVARFAPDDFVVNNGEVELSDNVIKEIETDSGAFTPSDGSFAINGGEGVDVFSTNTAIIVSGEDASDTNKGIASFDATNFTANNGNITSNPITLGSTEINLGNTETSIEGLDSVEVGTLRLDTNTISSTANNENIVLDPNGTGVVSVENSRITGVSNPTADLDAVNKRYVDDVAQGLSILPSAEAATTVDLGGTYSNGSNTATITIANTATLDIDGVTSWEVGDNVLVKDQTNTYENGSYELIQLGNANNSFEWVLTRAEFNNEESEIPGSFEFVTSGTEYVNTGWVATVPSDFEFGSSDPSADQRFTTKGDIVWVQFSGAGTFIAGDGLSLTGNEFSVNVDDTTIEIATDTLRVKNSGITNSKLANPFVSIAAETGSTDQVNLGETLTFAAGEGINTTVSDNQILIASEDATLTNKGAASFGGWADDGETVRQFSVTSGDVRVEAIDGGTY